MDTEREPGGSESALVESARGWHKLQLAVLGFVGLCGVLQAGNDVPGPSWLDPTAGSLALGALVVACVATYLVGRVAWPWGQPTDSTSPSRPAQTRTLRVGVVLTYVAVAAVALAALANWWPGDEGTESGGVRVTDAAGRSWCGQLVEAPRGSLRIVTARGAADINQATVAAAISVDGC